MSSNRLNYVAQLVADVSSMYLNTTNSDVTFLVVDKHGKKETLPGHTFILMARNNKKMNELLSTDVLRSLTVQDNTSTPQKEDHDVHVNVWSLEGFRVLLQFFYTGELIFPDTLAID